MKINLEKNSIIHVGEVENVNQLACELGCKVGALPSTYLRLPLEARQNAIIVWDGAEERFHRRLAVWKSQYISKGGRLTLIRSTLSSLPLYLLFGENPKGLPLGVGYLRGKSIWLIGGLYAQEKTREVWVSEG